MAQKTGLRTRFHQRYTVNISTMCWEWDGALDGGGYGHFCRKMAHRFAYEMYVGKIHPGLTIDHLCRVRSCVNPFHLEAVTQRENVLRGEGFAAVHARKTHCIRGHELYGDNVFPTEERKRSCKACARDRSAKRYREICNGNVGPYNAHKTHCPQGHAYAGDNLIITLEGHRRCRICKKKRDNTYYHRTKSNVAAMVCEAILAG